MAATPADLRWRRAASAGSLGGGPSTDLHDTEGTITATATPPTAQLFDNALGGSDGDHDGKWLVMLDGGAALYAGLVLDYTASSGRFILDTPLTGSVGIGDTYRLFYTSSPVVFPSATALQCANGTPDHRVLWVTNDAGETIDENRVWVRRLNFGPLLAMEVFVDDANGGTGGFPTIADAEAGPTDSQLNTVDPDGDWYQPPSYAAAEDATPSGSFVLSSGNSRAMYVRRRIPQATKQQSNAAVMLLFEGTDQTPQQVIVPAVVGVDFDGFTPDVTAKFDRLVYVGGGARVEVQVNVQELGIPAVDVGVGFGLVAPSPGSLELPGGTGTVTDDDGKAFASYSATEDQGDAGETVTVDVRV